MYKQGWEGVAVECDAEKFAQLSKLYIKFPNVRLVRNKIVPDNVNDILKGCSIPKNFAFLNFDIDGYDFYVLDSLLSEYRPSLMCVEINEKIPPHKIYGKIFI